MGKLLSDDELYHHGILGQKWGVRRFQNKDGTLTSAGKKRYQKEFYESIATGIYRKDIDYDKLHNSKELKDRAKKEMDNETFKREVENARKATDILDKFDQLPREDRNKYYNDSRADDYWGTFKLYLIDTDRYDDYMSACQSYEKCHKQCIDIAKDLLGKYSHYTFEPNNITPLGHNVAWQLESEFVLPDTINQDLDDPELLTWYDSKDNYHTFSTEELKRQKKDGTLFAEKYMLDEYARQ